MRAVHYQAARLRHALDGVKIIQRIHAGNRLGGYQGDIFGQHLAMDSEFMLMKTERSKNDHGCGNGRAGNENTPIPFENMPPGMAFFFEFNGLHHPGGKVGRNGNVRKAAKQLAHLPLSLIKRFVVHHEIKNRGWRKVAQVFIEPQIMLQNEARRNPVFWLFCLKMTNRQRFLDACHCRIVDRPPVWLMRQAGRALPEYRELKAKHDFLELVRTPELAAEVTLQPIRRFDFDAAILFSDILVVAEGLGQGYRFRDGGGIQMDFALQEKRDIDALNVGVLEEKLDYVPQAIRLLKKSLGEKTAMIGFAGSPWTLANFMLEGGSAKEFTSAKNLFLKQPETFSQLMEKLTASVTKLLQMQIAAGADAVQIFDSLGGLLPPKIFRQHRQNG